MLRFNLICEKNNQNSPMPKKSLFSRKTWNFESNNEKNTYIENIILYLSPLLHFDENYTSILDKMSKSPIKLIKKKKKFFKNKI